MGVPCMGVPGNGGYWGWGGIAGDGGTGQWRVPGMGVPGDRGYQGWGYQGMGGTRCGYQDGGCKIQGYEGAHGDVSTEGWG